MAKTIELIKKYKLLQSSFEDMIDFGTNHQSQKAKVEFKSAYESTQKSLLSIETPYDGDFSQFNFKQLLKRYLKLNDNGELSAKQRGELKALIEPEILKYLDKSYEKMHKSLFSSLKSSFKIPFSQAKILNDIGTLEHGGRCLPLSKMFLVAAKQDSLNEFFNNIHTAATNKGNEALLLGSMLKSFHAKDWHEIQTSQNQSLSDVAQKLQDSSDIDILLNTPVHTMAISKHADKLYFFDANSGVAKFDDTTSLLKSLGNYLRSEYGKVIQAENARFDSVVSVDTQALANEKIANVSMADESFSVDFGNLLSKSGILTSTLKSKGYEIATKNLPPHASFNENNNNAPLIKNLKTATKDLQDGGYWLGRVDGQDSLLLDTQIGYDFYKFKYFLQEHSKTNEQAFSYLIKQGDRLDVISFDNESYPYLTDSLDKLSKDQTMLTDKTKISNLLKSSLSDDSVANTIFDADNLKFTMLKHSVDVAKFSNSITNILQAARSLSVLATSDNGAEIASESVSVVGVATDIASGVVSTPVPNLILNSTSNTLASIAALINVGSIASKWSDYSKSQQVAAGFELGLKSAGALGMVGANVANGIAAFKGLSHSTSALGAAAASLALVVSPLKISSLIDESNRQNSMEKLAELMSEAGYEGDALLANLLKDKLVFESGTTGVELSLSLGSAIVQVASAASAVGAPVAGIVGLVSGIILGIMEASKQSALDELANRYKTQILAYKNGVGEFFASSDKALLKLYYDEESVKDKFKAMQKEYGVDFIVSLDGTKASDSVLELAAITGLIEQVQMATNHANLIKNGELISHEAKFNLDQKTGELNLNSNSDESALIAFNTPLFIPGVEEASRYQNGKYSYYTSLLIKGPSEHTINASDADETFVSADKYASILLGTDGLIKKKIGLNINAGAGDDKIIADTGFSNFDGEEGLDSVSYEAAGLWHVAVNPDKNGGYTVSKITQNADIVAEVAKTTTKQYGKNSETITYRDLVVQKADIQTKDLLSNIEIVAGTHGDDTMRGGEWDDLFLGLGGDDVIDTGDGNDVVDAGDGDDTIKTGLGNDTINQSDAFGSDFINGDSGVDTLNLKDLSVDVEINMIKNSLHKGDKPNPDTIIGIENIIGTNHNDTIIANALDNVLVAGGGRDMIIGGGGDDTFVGNAGINWLIGGTGNDTYALRSDAINLIYDSGGANIVSIFSGGASFDMVLKHSERDLVLSFIKGGEISGMSVIKNYAQFLGSLYVDDSESFLNSAGVAYHYDADYGILSQLDDEAANPLLLIANKDVREYISVDLSTIWVI